jgi:C4-dicarboxylate-specific signal transduction histidine kinase
MITFFASLAARLQRWVAAVAMVAVALGAVYAAGRRKGKSSAEDAAAADKARANLDAAEHTLETVRERHHVETEIAGRPDGNAADRLRNDWSRD